MSENPKPRRRRLPWIGLLAAAALAGLLLAARSVALEGDMDGERLRFDTAPLFTAQLGEGDGAFTAELEKIHAEYVNGDRSIGYRLDLSVTPRKGQTGCTGRLETLLTESQAQAIRGILMEGYPGSTVAELQKRLKQPALSENDAIIATQLAIWRARYDMRFTQTEKLSTAARALLDHLYAVKPVQANPWVLECEPAALIVPDPTQVSGPIRVTNRKNASGRMDLRLEGRQSAYFVLPKAGAENAYARAGEVLEGVSAGEYYLQLPRGGDGRLNLWITAQERLPVREDIGYLDAALGRLVIWANEGIMTPAMRMQVSWGEVSAPTAEVLANPVPVDTPSPPASPGGALPGGTLGTPIDPNSGAAAGSAVGGPTGEIIPDPLGGTGAGGAIGDAAMPGIPILTPPPGIPIPNPNGAPVPTPTPHPNPTGASSPGANPPEAAAPSLAAAPVQPRHRTAKPAKVPESETSDASPAPSHTQVPVRLTIAPEINAIDAPGHLRLRYLSNALIVLRRQSITVEPAWEDATGKTELPTGASLEWSSSNPSVASLYANDGLCTIEARSLGECIITLSVRGRPDVSTRIRLTVAEPLRETSEDAARTLRLRAPGFTEVAEVKGEISE